MRPRQWGLAIAGLLAANGCLAQTNARARATLNVTLTVLAHCVERASDGRQLQRSASLRCAPRSARVRSPSTPREAAVLADPQTVVSVQPNLAERRLDVLF